MCASWLLALESCAIINLTRGRACNSTVRYMLCTLLHTENMVRRIIIVTLYGNCRHCEALRREHVTSMLADMRLKCRESSLDQ